MGRVRNFWRSLFDIRAGEGWRVFYMGMYLLLVLFAYYILKPVSRGMFLFRFDIDELPYLYILIAAAGGVMAYVYTKIAIHASLKKAVDLSTAFLGGTLVLIWALLGFGWPWLLYFFNAFVSLFSITIVSQGWMVAANIFTTREAKRVYGVLGLGAVLGAAFGGTFTAMVVHYVGTRHLVLASVACVVAAWFMYRAAIRQPGVNIEKAKGAGEEDTFSLRDVTEGVRRHRHLQVIIAIIALTFIVDVTVEYQFNAMVKEQYDDSQRELVAFLGQFFGIWLNLATFVFQAFLTAFVISRFGVGGALQIMPVSISIASIFTFSAPGVLSTAAARLTEAATRYTFNRTGMELLYLPLPIELRNRTKAFTDIFVDRFARGVGGVLLIFLTNWLGLTVKQLALVVLGYCSVWVVLSIRARNEYVGTVRKRLEMGRLDLDALRVNVTDAATIRLLEQTTEKGAPGQAVYALSLLADIPGYAMDKQLKQVADSKLPVVRGKVYEIARERGIRGLNDQALGELRTARPGHVNEAIEPAVAYAVWHADDPAELAGRLLTHPHPAVSRSAMQALAARPDAAAKLITAEWIDEAIRSPDANRRTLAALAIGIRGDSDTHGVHTLLRDPDPEVAKAACATAGKLQNRAYLDGLLRVLPNSRLRRHAIDALSAYGERIVGTLGDVLLDTTSPPPVRRQIPRALRAIPSQRSADVLLNAVGEDDLTVRTQVLKALNSLHESNPKLNFGRESLMQSILSEARYYYRMNAALQPFKEQEPDTPAVRLLVETIQVRLKLTLERLFRLLGLRYPPKEIYAAYLAMNRRDTEQHTAAIEFLDNVLDRELKRVVMPLLDDDGRAAVVGRDLFGLEIRSGKEALRDLMRTGDSWLVACAVATAAEMGLKELRPDIESLAHKSGTEVSPVAQSALATFAA